MAAAPIRVKQKNFHCSYIEQEYHKHLQKKILPMK